MFRVRFFFILLFLISSVSVFSQTLTQIVRGKILDVDSKTALVGVAVAVIDVQPQLSAVTDADGKFRIENVPVGRRTIKVSVLGYQEINLNSVIVTSGKELVLNLEMQEKVYEAKEVVIVAETDKTKANNDLVSLSARNFNMEETNRYAGSRGDPARMAANFAGVVSQNDARNDIIVRGNSPIGVLWRLEGVDIPSPNHFSSQGAVGGPISILNNNLLANSDFLTGAFPAEYGNKSAAAFDLKLRNGNNEKTEFTGQVGINGAEIGVEGPINKKNGSSYLINYRYSTMKVFDLLGISFGVSGVPNYQDLSFKVNFPTEKAGIFSVWGIGGMSKINLLDSEKKESDWSFSGVGTDLVFGSSMAATGLSHVYFFNEKTSGKLNLAFTGNSFGATVDTLSITKVPYRTYTTNTTDAQAHVHYVVNSKINRKNLVKVGVYYQQLFVDYFREYYYRKFNTTVRTFDQKGNTGLLQSYAHWQYRLNDKLVFNNGLHYQQLLLNNTKVIEPRSGLKYILYPNHVLSAAYGMHNQNQPLSYYFYETVDTSSAVLNTWKTNYNLGFTQSQHAILAYDYSIGKSYRIKVETYYQWLNKVPIKSSTQNSFSMVNAGSNIEGLDLQDSLVNKGTGYNKGVELTFEKFYSNNFYFLVNASLFESKYKGSDNVLRHSAFSGGYAFNALAGMEFPLKNNKHVIAIDAKIVRVGGNRYVPIDLEKSIERQIEVLNDASAYSMQFKDYSKIDLKLSYKINQKRVTQSLFVSIENIFKNKNILRQTFDPQTNSIRQEFQFGFFPYGGYRIEF